MKKRIMTLAFLGMTLSFLSGCASVSAKREFADIQEQIKSRTKSNIGWDSSDDDQQIEEKTQFALERKLTTDAAVEIAFMNNPSLQAAFEELGIAKADFVQAGLLKNPSLRGSFRKPDPDGETNTEFEVKQDILDLFTLPLRKKLAREELEKIKYTISKEVLELDAQVRTAFYTLQAAEQLSTMQEKIVQAAESAVQLAEAQMKAGNINDLVLTGHQLALHQSQMDLTQREFEVSKAREELGQLLGLSENKMDWEVAENLPYISKEEPSLEALEIKAMAQNFELALARQEVEIKREGIIAARMNLIPDMQGGYNTEKESDGNKLSGPVFEVAIPVFDQKQAPVARAQAQFRQSKHQFKAMENKIASEVRVVYAKLLTERETIEMYRDAVIPLHEKFIRSLQGHYNYMLVGVYDLLDAKKEEIETYHKFVETLKDYWITRCELEHLVGERFEVVPFENPPSEIKAESSAPKDAHHYNHDHHGGE